jgi:hypothetical protein
VQIQEVGCEGISVVEKEGDDMLTHPHNKVSKLHSKEPPSPTHFCRFFRCFLSVSITGFSILLEDFMSKTLGALHLGFRF